MFWTSPESQYMHGAFRKADRWNIKDYYLSQISSTNTASEETIVGVSIFKGAGGPEDWGHHARFKVHWDSF